MVSANDNKQHLRLVIVSDTHNQFDKLTLPDGDVLIHCGDFTDGGLPHEVAKFNAELLQLPHKHKILVAGNHDFLFESRPEDARKLMTAATYLQDDSVTIDGIKFYGAPWQPEYGGWAFNVPAGSKRMQKLWEKIPDDTDVLITHSPPFGILDKNVKGVNSGCELLLARVQQVRPIVHCFGHIHFSYGREKHFGVELVNGASCRDYTIGNAPVVIDVPLRQRCSGEK